MSKVCFYIMRKDTGFAPNPFYNWCSLLACAPNYANAKLLPGDHIAGFFRSGKPPRLVYIMEVSEKFDYNNYYEDPRFQKKKPQRDRTWRERAGNNIYFLNSSGQHTQDQNACYHTDSTKVRQDLKHPLVFVGRNFAYFGEKAETYSALVLPRRFHWCLPQRAIKYLTDDCPDYEPFVRWAYSHGRGIIGLPRDREEAGRVQRGRCIPLEFEDKINLSDCKKDC